ncbi:TPA: hypothetical protein ACIZ32_001871 [Streptococcus agalactiae]
MTKLILLVDFDWITDSYFIQSSKFNWIKFFSQFITIDLIFVLPLIMFNFVYYLLNEKTKGNFGKLVETVNVVYPSIVSVITLSLTANELVFTFITSVIAFIVLTIQISKFIFKQQK